MSGFTSAVHEAKFNGLHTYSAAPEAAKKRALDMRIMDQDYKFGSLIDMKSESYLKMLIDLASDGKKSVKERARGLQFFIVKGGAEGFLDASYQDRDASRIPGGSAVTTDGKPGTTMIFDDNDLIAVFDTKGKLVSSALLSRPISIATPKKPLFWTEPTANKVYDAWDGQPVSIYRNETPGWIKYYGLWINDKLSYYANGWVRIDLHKKEATNGCIFILDPNTPPHAETDRLNAFEPQFILDVQKKIGAKTKWGIGTMHMVKVQ